MRSRREEVQKLLASDEVVMSLTNFPRLGCLNFTSPEFQPRPLDPNCYAQSNYFPGLKLPSND